MSTCYADALERLKKIKNLSRDGVQKVTEEGFGTSGTTPGTKKEEIFFQRHAYKFKLHNGEGGGIYLTDSADVEAARGELLVTYGERLALVVRA